MPILFKIWESINSATIDERIVEVAAALARENMSRFTSAVEGGPEPWKDVGIFEEAQWARICRACLVSMSEYSLRLRPNEQLTLVILPRCPCGPANHICKSH